MISGQLLLGNVQFAAWTPIAIDKQGRYLPVFSDRMYSLFCDYCLTIVLINSASNRFTRLYCFTVFNHPLTQTGRHQSSPFSFTSICYFFVIFIGRFDPAHHSCFLFQLYFAGWNESIGCAVANEPHLSPFITEGIGTLSRECCWIAMKSPPPHSY